MQESAPRCDKVTDNVTLAALLNEVYNVHAIRFGSVRSTEIRCFCVIFHREDAIVPRGKLCSKVNDFGFKRQASSIPELTESSQDA